MAEEKGTILTESGLKKLEEQLDYLVSVRRNEISEQIAVARGFGDLSENAEYDEAKKEQAKVEAEITRLQATIRTATVVADDEITTERVSVGTIVKVKDLDEDETYEYAIVGANEADPAAEIEVPFTARRSKPGQRRLNFPDHVSSPAPCFFVKSFRSSTTSDSIFAP